MPEVKSPTLPDSIMWLSQLGVEYKPDTIDTLTAYQNKAKAIKILFEVNKFIREKKLEELQIELDKANEVLNDGSLISTDKKGIRDAVNTQQDLLNKITGMRAQQQALETEIEMCDSTVSAIDVYIQEALNAK